MKIQKKAFTLVELIVVVTILAILSTIGFVSYSSYLTWVRDTNRISNMKAISDWLELYRTKYSLPLPENKVEIKSNNTLIARQWYAWANVLESIEFSNWWKDPKNDIYYSYYLTKDKKYFQLMWFLEEEDNLQEAWIFKQSQALDYSVLYPTVYGKKLGILTWTWWDLNTPIQEISTVSSSWELDVATTTTEYVAHFSDTDNLSGTWTSLVFIEKLASVWWNATKLDSCKQILDIWSSNWSWLYNIDPEVNGTWFEVYCDMVSDWGGWTLLYHQDTTKNLWAFIDKIEASNYNQDNPSIDINKYSILDKMAYFAIDGVFEFKLFYPLNNNNRNIWKQTLNPFTTTSLDPGDVGYEAVSIDFTDNYWGWIEKNSGDGSLIDWSINGGYWYNSIWTITEINSAFPWCWNDPGTGCGTDEASQSSLFVR